MNFHSNGTDLYPEHYILLGDPTLQKKQAMSLIAEAKARCPEKFAGKKTVLPLNSAMLPPLIKASGSSNGFKVKPPQSPVAGMSLKDISS